MQRVDPQVQALAVEQAARCQQACVPGLPTARLRLIVERLGQENRSADPVISRRIEITQAEIQRRLDEAEAVTNLLRVLDESHRTAD